MAEESVEFTSSYKFYLVVKSLPYFVPAIIWALIIFMLSTNTPVEVGPPDWLDFLSIDKAGHLVFYSIFCVLVCWGYFKIAQLTQESSIKKYILPILLVISYGIIMEFLQLKFYEGRHLEFMDMVANTIGAFIGAAIFKKVLINRL